MVARGLGLLMMCSAITVYIGNEPVSIRLAPRGNCPYCCPLEERRDITFYLYTASNPNDGQLLAPDDDFLLANSNLNPELPIVIYIHGFMEDSTGASSTAMKNAYLKRGGWNIILVEWESLCAAPFYVAAVRNSQVVGKYLARFLRYLDSHGHPMNNTHIVGFSLGAEVAGFAGKELQGKLPRITGLDPAYPLFHIEGWKCHLHHTDAHFVDVIHSDGGLFGFPTAIGHVDFYPNNGKLFQPGCNRIREKPTSALSYSFIACSHRRAWKYYVESITNDCGFIASECVSWNHFNIGSCHDGVHKSSYMGIAADKKARGMYFLRTNSEPPFAMNYGCPRPKPPCKKKKPNNKRKHKVVTSPRPVWRRRHLVRRNKSLRRRG